MAVFADDILVLLEELENLFLELMTFVSDFGKPSGYKLNISKNTGDDLEP